MMLTVVPVEGGPLSSTSYVIQTEEESWIVDCGDYSTLKPHISTPIKGIFLTHSHFDHINGLNDLLYEHNTAKVYTNTVGERMLFDPKKNLSHYHDSDFKILRPDLIEVVNNQETIYLGSAGLIQAIFTPGHNPSCITWVMKEYLFTGDAFIPGVPIVTKLPFGNRKLAMESKILIQELSYNRTLYPGHGINSNLLKV